MSSAQKPLGKKSKCSSLLIKVNFFGSCSFCVVWEIANDRKTLLFYFCTKFINGSNTGTGTLATYWLTLGRVHKWERSVEFVHQVHHPHHHHHWHAKRLVSFNSHTITCVLQSNIYAFRHLLCAGSFWNLQQKLSSQRWVLYPSCTVYFRALKPFRRLFPQTRLRIISFIKNTLQIWEHLLLHEEKKMRFQNITQDIVEGLKTAAVSLRNKR
jgi:hypothetical protein